MVDDDRDGEGEASNELATQLRRGIVITGYVVGLWRAVHSVVTVIVLVYPLNRSFSIGWWLKPVYQMAMFAYLAAPLLLVIGVYGFHRHRRWARPVLLTHAGMWIAGGVLLLIVSLIELASGAYGPLPSKHLLMVVMGQVNDLLVQLVFPVLLIFALRLPAMRDRFPEQRTGFTPIFKGG